MTTLDKLRVWATRGHAEVNVEPAFGSAPAIFRREDAARLLALYEAVKDFRDDTRKATSGDSMTTLYMAMMAALKDVER